MKQGIQTLMAEAGEAACYALCIIEIAERVTGQHIDCMQEIIRAIDKKYIYYNWKNASDNDNFTVLKPAEWLSEMSSYRIDRKWLVEKAPAAYTAREGEYVVDRWERQATGKTTGHFRLPDWDSLADSQTVKYGHIASKRVFRRVS
jgi:hypothetical protein